MYKWSTNFAIISILVLQVFAGQASAGRNANATLSLDLIPYGGMGNQVDNGVTSGDVSGRGTKIAVEVFAKGVTTSLVGVKIEFEFDASVLNFEKAENSAFLLAVPEAAGINFASVVPVTLPPSGFLARAEFTAVSDVTGREVTIGIKAVTLAESMSLTDLITTTDAIRLNASLSPDFDGDGRVGFADFVQFAGLFGASRGDGTYQAKYDLDSNGAIGFSDFVIFINDFGKSVSPSPEGGRDFNIELVFVNDSDFTSSQKAVFRQAARHWMSIITEDIKDIDFSINPYNKWDEDLGARIRVNDTVDDLRIFVRAIEIDGSENALGRGGPLFIRGDTYLPILGKIFLDTADLQRVEEKGYLEAVVLHEMGHVLGIGTLWEDLNLLRGNGDKHFTGPLSIQAFDNAGGRNYNGAKVPTESDGGHWRESVLGVELMTPRLGYNVDPLSAILNPGSGYDAANLLSAITIQSLADLGYRVNVSQADAYSLPAPSSGKLVGDQIREWGDCILKGPIYVSDENGRIIHIIGE